MTTIINTTPTTSQNVGRVQADKILARHAHGWESWPTLAQAAEDMVALEKEQAQTDVPCVWSDLRMRPETGKIFRKSNPKKEGLAITKNALRHLTSLMPETPTGLVNVCWDLPNKTAAEVFNHYAERLTRSPDADKAGELRLWRAHRDAPVAIRAAVSCRYADASDAVMLTALARHMPADNKCRAVVGQDHTTVEVIIPGRRFMVGKGDVVYSKAEYTNSHTKMAKILVRKGAMTLRCLNGAVVMTDAQQNAWRHVGDDAKLERHLQTAMRDLVGGADVIGRLLAAGMDTPLPDGMTRDDVFAALRGAYAIRAEVTARASKAWDSDPMQAGNTLTGFHNALTAAARDEDVVDATAVETVATEVLTKGWATLI